MQQTPRTSTIRFVPRIFRMHWALQKLLINWVCNRSVHVNGTSSQPVLQVVMASTKDWTGFQIHWRIWTTDIQSTLPEVKIRQDTWLLWQQTFGIKVLQYFYSFADLCPGCCLNVVFGRVSRWEAYVKFFCCYTCPLCSHDIILRLPK